MTQPATGRFGDTFVQIVQAPFIGVERVFGYLGHKTIRLLGSCLVCRQLEIREWKIPRSVAALTGIATVVGTFFLGRSLLRYANDLRVQADLDWKIGNHWTCVAKWTGIVAIISAVAFAVFFTATGLTRGVLFGTL
jgi:hypothetical protein